MLKDGKILIGRSSQGKDTVLLPKMANRHGLIAGATGTGKTVTLKVLAESFSDLGVPVFLADVKGDLSGMIKPGAGMEERVSALGLEGFAYKNYPTVFWDIYGQSGIPLRTTVSEMGPLLLSRILGLNDTQGDILTVAFKIADDEGLLLTDTKDLKALLNYISENNKELAAEYGKMSPVSISAILRAVVALEMAGGETFFGEPALSIHDLISLGTEGRGTVNILDSKSLIQNNTLYSMFLLWLLSELFENLPEVGDLDKPKFVFFFDEAHLLFKGTPSHLLEKIEQVVKLVRSKGVGIYFITQNPRDIPDGVLAQLGNRIEHALHAYTPAEQKAVKAAAASFRENPEFDTYEAIMGLGTGEAVISLLGEDGAPTMAEKATILPPQSALGEADAVSKDAAVKGAILYSKYAQAVDNDSAYEFLQRRGLEAQAAAEQAAADAAAAKEQAKAEAAALKEKEKAEAAALREKEKAEAKAEKEKLAREKRVTKSIGHAVTGTVGREIGKAAGSPFGKIGKRLGGNVGASLGRGILDTLFKL